MDGSVERSGSLYEVHPNQQGSIIKNDDMGLWVKTPGAPGDP